jgi:NADPH2:quinone reductase|tara:strand:- start:10951 stop:11088 length:138 start_codon:yes stop_codon:yes gene_type:complete
MTKAIRIHAFGGPEVLQMQSVDETQLATGQMRVKHEAIGLGAQNV